MIILKLFFLFVGFTLTNIGLVYLIIYLNLFTFGYNLIDYIKFIFTRIECLSFILGVFILLLTINRGDDFIELYL